MLVVALLFVAAAVDPALVGSWDANLAGIPMSLVVDAGGRCALEGESFACSTKAGALTLSDGEGSESYRYALSGSTLTLSGGDMEMALTFQRRGGAPAQASMPAAAAAPAATAPPEKATKESGARGSFTKAAWGATFQVPGGWKAGEKDGSVLMGSDTEAGLIIVRFFPTATREGALAEFNKGVHEGGVDAAPVGPAGDFSAKGGKGIAGELSGADQQGNALKIRTVAVFTPHGGALSVSGLTSPAQYATLKARTDAVAASATFKKPPRVSGLAGRYDFIYVSKVGSYSREATLVLCGSGRFSRKGELAGSGDSGQAFVARGNSGTWTAVGDASGGTLTLTFDDGSAATVPFSVSTRPADVSAYGPGVRFGNDLYQKTGDGGC
jgi:hypothetical protein